jgi:hypothetical protein
MAVVACSVWSQSLDTFKNAFTAFSGEMAASLAVNSTVGETWSDAYVGGFPHLGVGLSAGAVCTGAGTATPLVSALGQSAPEALDRFGIPIPTAVASLKIGLPFLPMDIGVKGGVITSDMASKLKAATGVAAEYKNVGVQLRYALVKETLLLPDVSLGVGFNYQEGGVRTSLGSGDKDVVKNETINGHAWTVTAKDPDLDLGWKSTTFDGTVQVSKTLLAILTPYVGAGYTMGTSTVTGGVYSTMKYTRDGGASDYSTLSSDITAMGGTPPALSDTGFSYGATSATPVFRVYGGFSLNILLVLDAQVMYIPATKNLGASVMTRIQL